MFSKITADDCVLFFLEFKPRAEEANGELRFIGANFQMDFVDNPEFSNLRK